MLFNFKSSLKSGHAGEELFAIHHPFLVRTDGKSGDFLTPNGNKIELKTDSYSMEKTENFFIERWSDVTKQKSGGPWQALQHGCKFYVYFYVKNMTYFRFKTEELVEFLESNPELLNESNKKEIKNKSWVTVGYKIPRELIKHLGEEFVYEEIN